MTTRTSLLSATEDEFRLDSPAYPGDLTRYWHPVALAEEVTREPGRSVLLGRPVVLFRDDQGVVAFRDLCVHRGTRLSLGRITPEGHLQCPYHGWEYDRTGQCVRIPARPPDAPIPRTACALAYKVREAYGLVWLCLDIPARPIPPFPGGRMTIRPGTGSLRSVSDGRPRPDGSSRTSAIGRISRSYTTESWVARNCLESLPPRSSSTRMRRGSRSPTPTIRSIRASSTVRAAR